MMSSTICGPFSEENDVSRQAGKPIYVEESSNDGQTQRTEQTLDSCTAVRAGHTVSDFAEDLTLSSDTKPSHPSEETCFNKFLHKYNLPLLPLPQTLKSFLHHLLKYSFFQSYKISVNIIIFKTHIYLDINEQALPGYLILSSNQYSIYSSSPILLSIIDY